MGMTAEEYRVQLQALLPPGAAWPSDPDAVLTQVLAALAEEFARVDVRAEDLVEEADPRTTYEMLADWERVAGLPLPCLGVPDTLSARRTALVGQLTALGGASPAYFIAVAAAIGYDISVTEYRPWSVNTPIDVPLYGIEWAHAWRVNAPAETAVPFTVVSGVNEPLQDWGNELLECLIRRLAPAHTVVLFAYGG